MFLVKHTTEKYDDTNACITKPALFVSKRKNFPNIPYLVTEITDLT